MTTGIPGDSARQYPWQVDHYFSRGGANDPVLPVTQALGTVPSSGGVFSWNSVLTVNPVPGQIATPRSMSINLSGTLIGGIYIGTIPQAAWIESVSFFVYTAFAGGACQSIGLGYVAEATDLLYPPTFTGVLGAINGSAGGTGPLAGLYGGERSLATAGTGDGYATATLASFQLGPGNGTTGSAAQLASLGDIDLYVFTGGTMSGVGAAITVPAATAFTSGSAAVRVCYAGTPG